jgi:hypothetical protein
VNSLGEPSKLVRTVKIETVEYKVSTVQVKFAHIEANRRNDKGQCEYKISDGVVVQTTDQPDNLSSPLVKCKELPNGQIPATGTSAELVAKCCLYSDCIQIVKSAIESSRKTSTPVEQGKGSSSVR